MHTTLPSRCRRLWLLACLLVLLGAAGGAQAATFDVNSADDVTDGVCDVAHCSLREAIEAANATPGADRLEFRIPGSGTQTITIAGMALPAIVGDLVIDGYTQPGALENSTASGALDATIRIELRGAGPSGGGIGLLITGSHVLVRGMAIASFAAAIMVDAANGSDITVEGSFLGTDAPGTVGPGSYYGVVVVRGAGVMIGGARPAARNLISANTLRGIFLNRSSDDPVGLTVQGNLIGTQSDGVTALGNTDAILIDFGANAPTPDDHILIGGSDPLAANVMAANTRGLTATAQLSTVDGSSFSIIGNTFGTDATRATPRANSSYDISFTGPFHARVEGNVIAHSPIVGIAITGARTTSGRGIDIYANRIYGSGGLGIDLGDDGRTPNDAGDEDEGPNARLNFTVLTSAQRDATSGLVQLTGSIHAEPEKVYRVEFFALATTGRPPGSDATRPVFESLIGTDHNGDAPFTLHGVLAGVASGDPIVATLTERDLGYTSEISDEVLITAGGPTIEFSVTLAGTSQGVPYVGMMLTGTETRATVTDKNGGGLFFGVTPGGTYTVTPQAFGYTFAPASRTVSNVVAAQQLTFDATPVPQATLTVNVTHDSGDGACLPAECTLREAIETANALPGANTIQFAIPGGGAQTVRIDSPLPPLEDEVTLDGYSQPGAQANTYPTVALDTRLMIALEPGTAPGADERGLTVGGERVTVRGLAIDGFQSGIIVDTGAFAAQQVTIAGNFIGTTLDGLGAGLPSTSGIVIQGTGAAAVTIGGLTPESRNLISGHDTAGIDWMSGESPKVLTLNVQGNLIGTDATGFAALANAYGLMMSGGPASADIVRIGGTTEAAANVIAATFAGIHIQRGGVDDLPAADQVIAGNFIGAMPDGVNTFETMGRGVNICGNARYVVRENVIASAIIGVSFCGSDPGRVTISANRMFVINGLGIDLGGDGPTPNDQDDADTGANGLQNFPELSIVQERPLGVDVVGALVSQALRSYRIELFRTGAGWMAARDSRELMDDFTVTTDAVGTAGFTRQLRLLAPGEAVIATATDELTGMTSEFSASLGMTPLPRFEVSGQITMYDAPLPGITVQLTGARTRTAQTDADGFFSFPDLPRTGNYEVTPVDAGYRFTPPVATLTNLQDHEFIAIAAVPSSYTRYLAEGAAGPFWESSIALFNPSATATIAEVAFLLPDGRTEQLSVPLTGPGHTVIDPGTIPALNGSTFSTTVRATEAIVASRTMRWGLARELGAHAEQAVSEARTDWYFAEGATGCFDLFYQLANPGPRTAEVEMTFVRRAPQEPVVRRYSVAPFARYTVHANGEEGLAFAEVSAKLTVTNGQPIVAERAMYSNCFGTTWRGGHDAAGSPAPGTTWRLAEGATGSFFDLYILLANFESTMAEVDVQYMLPDGTVLVKPYKVPPGSRMTIDVAGEAPQLEHAAVSTYISSENGVPIVAERAQWWPHGNWYEGHVSAGASTFGYEWHVAGAQLGGPHGVNSYLLIANTGNRTGAAEVSAVLADGSVVTLPETVTLPGHSRTTVDLAAAFAAAQGQSFGLIVKSVGTTPSPIVVELSSYGDTHGADGTRFWGAGTNTLGTRAR